MARISSIHICPLKSSAMFHNDRRKDMPHVRGDLTHLNEKWENPLYEGKSIGEIRKDIERRYFENVHQRMQAKAVPLREGVVNIREDTTLDELRHLADRLQQEFGIHTVAIHTHRDEGHEESGEWITNHHAHLILDWTNDQGKSLNLKSPDMARMQTIVAEALNMERGKSSDVKHLDAIQYKNMMQEQQNRRLLETAEQLREEISKLRISRKGKEALLQRLDKFSGLFGKSDVRLQLDASQDEIAQLKEQLDELRQKVENIQQNLERRTRERDKAREEAENKKREGSYRVIRTKDKTYWVQQFVFDYPDKQYYPPNDTSGGNAYFKCWHWKFLSGYSYKISAIQYLERAMQADVSDAKRKAMEDAIERERRENLKVAEIVDYKITDTEYLALLKDRSEGKRL